MKKYDSLFLLANKIHFFMTLKSLDEKQKDLLIKYLNLYDTIAETYDETNEKSRIMFQTLSTPIIKAKNAKEDNEAILIIKEHFDKGKGYTRIKRMGNAPIFIDEDSDDLVPNINGFIQVFAIIISTILLGIVLGILLIYIK